MSTMNISLLDSLKSFVDEQVSQRGYGISSEHVRELIRKDQDRLQSRALLLDGASSEPAAMAADGAYFDQLQERPVSWPAWPHDSRQARHRARRLDRTHRPG